MLEPEDSELKQIQALAQDFFPDCRFTNPDSPLETVDKDEIFYREKDILSSLQTLFFEELLVEVQWDQGTRVFFSQLIDEPPGEVEDAGDGVVIEQTDHEPGGYLKEADFFLLTPVTPPIGNAHARLAEQCIVRFFRGATAIELGCTFREQALIGETPALRFNFPVIGRVKKNFRSFRVKAGASADAKVVVHSTASPASNNGTYQLYDASVGGMAFELPDGHQDFEVGEVYRFSVMVADLKKLKLSGTIRNISKVRDKRGHKIICGIQFDLESRALAADLEKLTATIQRLHLRELAEKTDDLEGVQLIR